MTDLLTRARYVALEALAALIGEPLAQARARGDLLERALLEERLKTSRLRARLELGDRYGQEVGE